MDNIQALLNTILHIDHYLFSFVSDYGTWTYLVLFAIIFCETAMVITPFLPGDSLLFAAGSLAAQSSSALDIWFLFFLLVIASTLGNQINYWLGRLLGPRVFNAKRSWLFNPRHLQEAHAFYEKNGGLTIILARFMPILRTFAPFVAGIGYMNLKHFTGYNIVSAILWIGSLLGFGYFFGSLPFIKNNFTLVIYGIVLISIMPAFIAYICRKKSCC